MIADTPAFVPQPRPAVGAPPRRSRRVTAPTTQNPITVDTGVLKFPAVPSSSRPEVNPTNNPSPHQADALTELSRRELSQDLFTESSSASNPWDSNDDRLRQEIPPHW